MENKNNKGSESFLKKITTSFQGKGFRSGVYATVVSVLVIAAVIVLNLIVSSLNIRKDFTTDGRYSLTKDTEELLAGVEDKITFYYLTKGDASISWFDTFFTLYEKENKNIDFKTVDLVVSPSFAEQYTDETVMQYSLIAVNEATGKSKYISYEDMLLTQLSIDPYTYEMADEVVGLDVEGQLNAAIVYLTNDNQTNLYAVTGHGEIALGTEGENLLRKANINYSTIETMTAEAIPEDCDVLYIAMPATDYTEAELAVIEAYMKNGGDVLVTGAYQFGMDNFDKLLTNYGIVIDNGIILEGDSNRHLAGYAYALLPIVSTEHEMMQKFTGTEYVAMQTSYAMKVAEDASLETAVLLSTSGKAYAKITDGNYISSMDKEEGDAEGPFSVGVYVKNTEYDSEAVVYSSGLIFYDECFASDSYANAKMLTGSINYMAGSEDISAVRTISFEEEEKLVVTSAEANTIGIVFVIVIPVLLVIIGVAVMLRRKNR